MAAQRLFAGDRLALEPARLQHLADDVLAGVELELVGAGRRGGVGVGDRRLAGLEGAVAVGVDVGADHPAGERVLAGVLVAVGVVVLVLDPGLGAGRKLPKSLPVSVSPR